MEAWISDFSKHVKMKEPRLEKRLIKIVKSFSNKPASSIPEACCSHSKTTAAYRFFDNTRVSANDIKNSFLGETLERIKDEKLVLIPTDITGLNYFTHKALEGTGPMRSQRSKGLVLASSLAVDKKGTPLGLIFQKLWGRSEDKTGLKARVDRKKLPLEQRESYVWIEAVKKMENTIPEDKIAIMIGDRGSDFYDLFDYKRRPNIELLIRAKTNRYLHNDSVKLFERMAFGKPDGITLVNVTRSRKSAARSAKVEIRFKQVEISVPLQKSKLLFKPIVLYAIEAKEVNVQKNVSNPILWRLVTTIPVKSITDAVEKVIWYAKRWLIERYHYALKSGCKVEELQLETIDRMEKALAVYCLIAWRLLFLTYRSRNNPHESCEKYFTKDEWTSCYMFLNKRKPSNKPPSLKEFIVMIAQLGGFLARKSDGDPGVKVIWRGLKRLEDISVSFANFKEIFVYNG